MARARTDPLSGAFPRGPAATIGVAGLMAFAATTLWMGSIRAAPRVYEWLYLIGWGGFAMLGWSMRGVLTERWTRAEPGALATGQPGAPFHAWNPDTLFTSIDARNGGASVYRSRWFMLAAGIRLFLLPVEPSDDAYRYVWEGRAQLAGYNPYRFAPDSDALASLRDADWNDINHRDLPTVYPPVAQMVFVVSAFMAPDLYVIKFILVVCDLLSVLVLARLLERRGRSPHGAAFYALCPLTLSAFAVEGHLDSLMLLNLILSVYCIETGRTGWAGVALGLAIGSKIVAVVLWPFFLRRHFKAFAISVVVLAVCYLPYLGVGADLFEGMLRFGGGSTFFNFIDAIVNSLLRITGLQAFDETWQRALGAVFLGSWILLHLRRRTDVATHAASVMSALLIAAPIVHYWYLTWALIWTPCRRRWAWMVMACASVIYFEAEWVRGRTGEWIMPWWAPILAWGVFLVTSGVEGARRIRRSQPRRSGWK